MSSASGVVPEIWRQLLDSFGATHAAAPADAPVASEPSPPAAEPPPCIEYSYERPPAEQLVLARVVSITDGDTFRALIGNQNEPIRMADYDSPERDQPYGREATAEVAKLFRGIWW